jgi:primosomal protein N' (replication factor Y)
LKLLQKGFGTEKLLEVLQNQFPEAKIGRFDRGAVKTFNELKETLEKFEKRELDVLIGTQMLSKGHNFKGVNLVVLLGIDSQLNFPDFRSNENAFQLITQTAGRPGRSEKKGKVLIQTLYPENKIFDDIKAYDHEKFYENEKSVRETLNYPPYSRLVAIYVNSRFQSRAREEMLKATKVIEHLINTHFGEVEILGPRPAIIEKRANNFTWTVLLRSNNISHLHNTISNFQKNFKIPSGVSLKLDIDPLFLH